MLILFLSIPHYFNASASSDGDGSKANPYKYYKSGRIDYGSTAYFADGIYYIDETDSIYSSSTYNTTFIGQCMEKTILGASLLIICIFVGIIIGSLIQKTHKDR